MSALWVLALLFTIAHFLCAVVRAGRTNFTEEVRQHHEVCMMLGIIALAVLTRGT